LLILLQALSGQRFFDSGVLDGTSMRLVTMASIMALIPAPAAGADRHVERIVARHVRSIIPPDFTRARRSGR
jgi:hypothetical protein